MADFLYKALGFDSSRHKFRTEIVAGITTFLTMAYILAVNPGIFSALAGQGMPTDAVFTATALAAVVGTLMMAFYAKKPFGLAPGMGLNAFFVYSVCLGMGYSWQFALTAIFIEGIIFIILSITKVREMIVNAIPTSLKNAIGAGIGLYIALIGLKSAGIVVDDEACLVGLAPLKYSAITPDVILALIGFVLTAALVLLNVKGGILIGILATTLIGIPMGVTHFNGVVSAVPSIKPIFLQFSWSEICSLDMVVVVLTFLFIDMFDTIGTVIGVSIKAGMVDEKGNVDGVSRILMADAVATTVGACLGASTTTTYIESASGVSAGGRTGLTSLTIAVCFALALFLSPLFLAIPSAATGPVLVIVGVMMMSPIGKINWNDYSEAIPAFLTCTMMPFTYSIAHGIMIGMISYVVFNAFAGNFKKISPVMWVLAVLFVLRYVFM